MNFPILQFSNLKINWRLETGDWKLASGFTLVELLIVVALLGILSVIALLAFSPASKFALANDAGRKNDIRQYQVALENFAARYSGFFPMRNATVSADTTLCSDLALSGCPSDPKEPKDATFDYKYQSDGTGSTGAASGTRYVLWAKLERSADYWVVCSNGKNGTKAQAGFTVSNGVCPL